MKEKKGRADRYDLEKARDLGSRGIPNRHALRVGNIAISTVAVADPQPDAYGGADQRVIAAVDQRVDILEYERAHGRISKEAYSEGRLVQAIFERTGLSGGSTWNAGSRVDAVVAKELAIIRRISTARAIEGMIGELRRILGEKSIDVEILRQVLGENRKYADVALPQRKVTSKTSGERNVTYVAQRFRDALETLARESRRR